MARRESGRLIMGLATILLALAGPAAAVPAPLATLPRTIAGQITSADYPAAALRAEAQGRTDASMTIDRSGRVTRCTVARSSGHAILDQQTCSIALSRMRFTAALDAAGQPLAVNVILPVVWAIDGLPHPAPAP
jgi:protein TonB